EAALVAAVQRGVHCRLMMDSLGSRASLRTLGPRLQAAGIEVIEAWPVSFLRRNKARLDLRNHRKIAVIDGQAAYVGSQNLVNATFKPGIVYEELVVRVTGPVVHQLQVVFLADRFMETETQRPEEDDLFPDPEPAGTSPAQALPSGPVYTQTNNLRLILPLLHAPRHRAVP